MDPPKIKILILHRPIPVAKACSWLMLDIEVPEKSGAP